MTTRVKLITALQAAIDRHPKHVGVRLLREFYTVKAATLGIPYREAVKTVSYYDRVLSRDVRDFYNGELDAGGFIDDLIRLVEEQLTRAWNEGMRNNDLDPAKDMTDEWRAVLQGEIDAEMEHILDYAQAIEDAAAAGEPIQPYLDRVQLWVNRYPDVVNLSMMTTKPEDRFIWVYGDTDHCETCLTLNGIIATGAQWEESGYRPQNPPNDMLECGGWHCQCRLEHTKYPVTAGGIPQM